MLKQVPQVEVTGAGARRLQIMAIWTCEIGDHQEWGLKHQQTWSYMVIQTPKVEYWGRRKFHGDITGLNHDWLAFFFIKDIFMGILSTDMHIFPEWIVTKVLISGSHNR